jgi:3-phosphoshikimate 1-carboxyvinyltransferase
VVSKAESALLVKSQGWQQPDGALDLRGSLSSQFASSLILNAWALPFPLQIVCDAEPVSEGYLALSMELATSCGMVIETSRADDSLQLVIPSGQQLRPLGLSSEADVSSAFAVAALAAVAGSAYIPNFPQQSLQPDVLFVKLLQQMGVPIALTAGGLSVERAERLMAIEVDLGGAPDLTPVLAVLCGLCPGRSRIFGAPQLRGKESDRIATTSALLSVLGRHAVATNDGLEIVGRPVDEADRQRAVKFDASGDHRLVMAAAVARWAGFPVEIAGLSAVEKSFPEFLSIAQLGKES